MAVLVIGEQLNGQPSPGTRAAITAAMQLEADCDLFIAGSDNQTFETLASLANVKSVKAVKHPRFEHPIAEDLAPIIINLAKDYSHILAPATTFGKNLMPRVAAGLNVGQISDITAIEGKDIFIRPIYAGNAYEKVQALDLIKILTIRPSAFSAVEVTDKKAAITFLNIPFEPFEKTQFIGLNQIAFDRPDLASADIVISGGRGLKNAENFKLLEPIADKLHAAIGATRAAVDAGFVPNDLQVGQTGKVIAPKLYIAVGISGAIQHLAGMKESKVIVAINTDPDAPIFQVADYGLVMDLFAFLPQFEAALHTSNKAS